jgi:O-methyltransferase involved in polyketide biosynthesis
MPIENISDTARWIAYVGALESARPDALFHDALAQRLAGEAPGGLRALMLNYAGTCVRLDDIRW